MQIHLHQRTPKQLQARALRRCGVLQRGEGLWRYQMLRFQYVVLVTHVWKGVIRLKDFETHSLLSKEDFYPLFFACWKKRADSRSLPLERYLIMIIQHCPVFEIDDSVGIECHLWSMGDHDDGFSFGFQLFDDCHDLSGGGRVKISRGLIG